ncbi:MAG: hypothetical protein M3Y32_00420 [Pseudomonadota bacterium]|nr:hypothetical protein [Pseudomonadota bacterium]
MNRPGRRSTLAATSVLRSEACPPSLRYQPDPADTPWQRWLFWLLAPAPQEAAPPLGQLPQARNDFKATVCDLLSEEADALRERIDNARSLRDLWHARAEIFRVVGLARSQHEAERRLAQIDHHFPTRAPRSQFASL